MHTLSTPWLFNCGVCTLIIHPFSHFNEYDVNSGNTVIVDDTPLKHIMNKFENVLLPNPWSHCGGDDRDTFLLHTLLPWIQRLHLAREDALKSFREFGPNRIGQRMLCDEQNRTEYNKVMELIRRSSSSLH